MKGLVNAFGAILALLGWAGIAEACTGQGSLLIGTIFFVVGFVMCLATMKGDSRKNGR